MSQFVRDFLRECEVYLSRHSDDERIELVKRAQGNVIEFFGNAHLKGESVKGGDGRSFCAVGRGGPVGDACQQFTRRAADDARGFGDSRSHVLRRARSSTKTGRTSTRRRCSRSKATPRRRSLSRANCSRSSRLSTRTHISPRACASLR